MTKLKLSATALSAFLLFQFTPAFAQSAPPVMPARTATPALWVVKDADTTIYLFGTFHFLPPGLNWNLGPVKTAFESADLLRLEVANLDAETPAITELMGQKGRLPAGGNVSDGLNDRQKQALDRVIAESKIPKEAVNTMQPWFASLALTITLYQQLGLDPAKGVDRNLDEMARARNIPVEGFETGAEQIAFFANMPMNQQRELLTSTLEDWDQAKKSLTPMVDAWSRGDANRIGRYMSEGLRSQPELARLLLTDRNSRWADWISARMATPGTVFVAVGTGHLAGRDSVQAFLRKKGLRATRVANPAR